MKRALIADGKITRAVKEGLETRARLIAEGTDEVDADRIVGESLRRAWGNSIGQDGREWRYYCERCKDTGWSEIAPDGARLDRLYGPGGASHPFYVKCEPCAWQNRERDRRVSPSA